LKITEVTSLHKETELRNAQYISGILNCNFYVFD